LALGCGEPPVVEQKNADVNVTLGLWTHSGLSLTRLSNGAWIDATGNTVVLSASSTTFMYTRSRAWTGQLRCSARMVRGTADVSPGSLLTQYGVAPGKNSIYMSSGNNSNAMYGCWERVSPGVEVRRVPRDSEIRLYDTPNNSSYAGVELWDGQGGTGYAFTTAALMPGTI